MGPINQFFYTSLKLKIDSYTSLSFILLNLVVPVALYKRVKGPKTPAAPDLTEFQKEVILGSILGDLTAERSHITGNTRLRFYMSSVNKDLIYHFYSIFKPYVKTGPKFIHRKLNKLTNLEHIDISFSTLKYALFNWAYEDFYVKDGHKNIKIVPKDIINKLTPVSLAYWIMDDGSFSKSLRSAPLRNALFFEHSAHAPRALCSLNRAGARAHPFFNQDEEVQAFILI